jgi:hypothetical protein
MSLMARKAEDFATIQEELKVAADRLRVELRACLEAALPTLDGARAFGRALGLKRQLGWRAWTVATSTDLPTVLEALPRRQGWKLVLASLRKTRCSEPGLQSLSQAIESMLLPLESGRINRAVLRSLASGRLDGPAQTLALLRARRAIREGAEQVYGVRCKAQMGTYVIGPAQAEGWVDIVTLMEYSGLQRQRPGPMVAVKAVNRMWHPSWKESRTSTPLGADSSHGGLVTELSSPDARERHLLLKTGDGKTVFHFEAGGTEALDPVNLVFGEYLERGGTVGTADELADLLLGVHVPSEFCVFEAWTHRSIRRLTDPVASLQGSLDPMGTFADMIGVSPLPLEAQAREIDGEALPRGLRAAGKIHAEALERAAKVLGGSMKDFVGFRVVVPDAPVGSRVHLQWRM